MGALLDAVRSGDKKAVLVAMRDSVAATLEDTTSGRDVAALSKRLIEIVEQIEVIDATRDERDDYAEILDGEL